MKRTTPAVLFLLLATVHAAAQTTRPGAAAPASPEHEAAEALLKERGLTRVGITYLLDVDARISEHLKPSRQAKKQLDDYARRRAAVARQIKTAEQQTTQWLREYRALNEQHGNSTGGPRARNQIASQINVLVSKIKEAEQYLEARKQELTKIPAPREDYGSLVAELAEKLEETDKRYAELARDEQVTAALAKLSERGPKFRLGPSPGFVSILAATRRTRDGMKSSVVRLTMDKGVPHVDVTLNGSVTRAMVVDSGAGLVSLTNDVGRRLGLTPGADDPVVKMITADGKTTEAHLMKLDTVKVGQFVVEDVTCAVMPAGIPADVCLLGGSFLENFVYRMDLAAGELHLTQVTGKTKDAADRDDTASSVAAEPTEVADAGATSKPSGKELRGATHPSGPFFDLFPTLKGNTSRKKNGAIVLQTGERVMTAKSYKPPVTFKVTAQTDSTNIRFGYAADHIIFNWELDPTHLRIDGGPASSRHEPGAGKVPTNEWVNFELTFLKDEMILRVNSEVRYRARADFSKVNQPLNIFTERGGTIMIKSVSVNE